MKKSFVFAKEKDILKSFRDPNFDWTKPDSDFEENPNLTTAVLH